MGFNVYWGLFLFFGCAVCIPFHIGLCGCIRVLKPQPNDIDIMENKRFVCHTTWLLFVSLLTIIIYTIALSSDQEYYNSRFVIYKILYLTAIILIAVFAATILSILFGVCGSRSMSSNYMSATTTTSAVVVVPVAGQGEEKGNDDTTDQSSRSNGDGSENDDDEDFQDDNGHRDEENGTTATDDNTIPLQFKDTRAAKITIYILYALMLIGCCCCAYASFMFRLRGMYWYVGLFIWLISFATSRCVSNNRKTDENEVENN